MSTLEQEGQDIERKLEQRMEDGFRDMIKTERDTPGQVAMQATTEVGNQRPMRRRWATRAKPTTTTNVPGDIDRGKRKCDDKETPYRDPYKRCFACRKMGHLVTECPKPGADGEGSSKGTINLKGDVLWCDMCGEFGHRRMNCILQIYQHRRFRYINFVTKLFKIGQGSNYRGNSC
ncbi:hypothetical protein LXL04_007400 [Taraxacum kok-saghyz]